MPDIIEAQARAMWAADMEVNEHSTTWEQLDQGTQDLYRLYAKAAEMAREEFEAKPS